MRRRITYLTKFTRQISNGQDEDEIGVHACLLVMYRFYTALQFHLLGEDSGYPCIDSPPPGTRRSRTMKPLSLNYHVVNMSEEG